LGAEKIQRMRILYITRSPPLPTHIGGNQRTFLMYQALSRVGSVDLCLAVGEDELSPQQREGIRTAFRWVASVAPASRADQGLWRWLAKFHHGFAVRLADILAHRKWDYVPDPRLQQAVRRLIDATQYDVAVIKSLSLAMKTGLPPDFPVVLDVDDVEYEWYESQLADPYASFLRKLVAARRLAQLSGRLPGWYSRYKYLWVTKQIDISYPGLQGARVVGVPFYTADGKTPDPFPDSAGGRTILMVGSYHHRPNRDGLEWFLRAVWSVIRNVRPDAQLRVVGGGLNERDVAAWRSHGAEFVGVAPDIAAEYAQCAFTIAPIWCGAGINVKVFESYLYGRPAVVTRFAYRGYEECLMKGEMVAVANDQKDFARHCVTLLDSLARRHKMVELGRPRILEAFSFERFAKVVSDTLHDVEHHRRGTAICE
jgi:glycosyltransferase involved in cell wall biosynthesis